VPCIDHAQEPGRLRRRLLLALPAAGALAACSPPERAVPLTPAPPPPAAPPGPTPAASSTPPVRASSPASSPASSSAAVRHPPLAPPQAARNWDEFRQQAARRLVQAHPDGSYTGPVAEPLLAIPVLEVELNADGSVRRIEVLRHPRQARDTTQLAIDAVRRAAPYGAMTRLPRPWKWAEVFLFDEQRRFKPRTLDE